MGTECRRQSLEACDVVPQGKHDLRVSFLFFFFSFHSTVRLHVYEGAGFWLLFVFLEQVLYMCVQTFFFWNPSQRCCSLQVFVSPKGMKINKVHMKQALPGRAIAAQYEPSTRLLVVMFAAENCTAAKLGFFSFDTEFMRLQVH